MNKEWLISNGDTDSLTFYKQDQSQFSEQERTAFLNELNELYPEGLTWEDDGYYPCMIVFKAKNYVLYDGDKIKTKGSAIKATTKEPALKEFINRIIAAIIEGSNDYTGIYKEYVKEAMDIKDIKRWVTRKTISQKTLNPQRTNEQKVFDIISDTSYSEGDRIYCFFKEDGSLDLAENFSGNYDREKMLEKLFKTSEVFNTVLPEDTFLNFKLKRNKPQLQEVLNG